ncbi:MAG: enoyl-CoA hydratase/isomerase family protein [Bdellovibrio sp.]
MDFQFLKLGTEGKVWTVTLSRPDALNALNSGLLHELGEALTMVEKAFPKQCLGLVITGRGEKSFVAGADIKEMRGLNPVEAETFARRGQGIFRRIEKLPVPVIAAVNGFALGGGLELALACDFVYASDNARMGLPEVSLGLIPGFGGTVRLARAVGLAQARELIFTGEMIKADQALVMGLVNRVMSQAELLPAAIKTLETIATRGPLAVQTAKKSTLEAFDQEIDLGLKTESSHFAHLFSTQDMNEGTAAFVEKRRALFTGQ